MRSYPRQGRRSIRLPEFDYSDPGSYFITICAHDRKRIFGECVSDQMHLSELGDLIATYWADIPDHFQNVEIDRYIVMPNHIHGVVNLLAARSRGTACRAPTVEEFGRPVAGSIPTIIRSFKGAVTSDWRLMTGKPDYRVWQRNYYERVVRDNRELNRLRRYILHNPLMWESDPLY